MRKILLGILVLVVVASGCTDIGGGPSEAQLVGTTADTEVTDEDPGEITLNAKNNDNETHSYYARVTPVGDYRRIVRITTRNNQQQNRFELGEAVGEATTGEQFAQVRKEANVSSTVKVKAELYRQDGEEVLDSRIYQLKTIEE